MTCVAWALSLCVYVHMYVSVCNCVLVRLVCDLLPRNQWACTRLLVGKLGHTGLVPFVDEFGTVCGEVPLEYGFVVLV